MNKYYTGIGSTKTPKHICEMMKYIAIKLESLNYVLRSGGAEGADTAFESGVLSKKEIYLPWKGFNESDSELYLNNLKCNKESAIYVKKYHPNYRALTQGAHKMMLRNTYQILGMDLHTPVDFVICWTKDGTAVGGTGQALRIAQSMGIEVYNLYSALDQEMLIDKLENI